MSFRTLVVVLGAVVSSAQGQAIIELVPDRSPPYIVGQRLTVDVWVHSEVAFDAFLFAVQLDFADSDPALSPDPTFTFDLSAIPNGGGKYATSPELPVPVVWVVHDGPLFPEDMLPLPAGGSLHIGSIGIQLPADPGVYRLDTLNADEPDELRGALIDAMFFPGGTRWRAFTGELTGGMFDFVVEPPPIPTTSTWGMCILALGLLTIATIRLKSIAHIDTGAIRLS